MHLTTITTELPAALFVHHLYRHASSFFCCKTSKPLLSNVKRRQSINCLGDNCLGITITMTLRMLLVIQKAEHQSISLCFTFSESKSIEVLDICRSPPLPPAFLCCKECSGFLLLSLFSVFLPTPQGLVPAPATNCFCLQVMYCVLPRNSLPFRKSFNSPFSSDSGVVCQQLLAFHIQSI